MILINPTTRQLLQALSSHEKNEQIGGERALSQGNVGQATHRGCYYFHLTYDVVGGEYDGEKDFGQEVDGPYESYSACMAKFNELSHRVQNVNNTYAGKYVYHPDPDYPVCDCARQSNTAQPGSSSGQNTSVGKNAQPNTRSLPSQRLPQTSDMQKFGKIVTKAAPGISAAIERYNAERTSGDRNGEQTGKPEGLSPDEVANDTWVTGSSVPDNSKSVQEGSVTYWPIEHADGSTTLLVDTDGDGIPDSKVEIPAGGGLPNYADIGSGEGNSKALNNDDIGSGLASTTDIVEKAGTSLRVLEGTHRYG